MLQSIGFGKQLDERITMEEEDGYLIFLFQGELLAYVKKIGEGIYETNSLNFDHLFEHVSDCKVVKSSTYEPIVNEQMGEEWRYIQSYGVCDNAQQILDYIPEINERPNAYVLILTSIKREQEPPQEGWRWHKWGEYIGTHEITAEYLYDEKEIDEVFVYHVYEVQPKSTEKE